MFEPWRWNAAGWRPVPSLALPGPASSRRCSAARWPASLFGTAHEPLDELGAPARVVEPQHPEIVEDRAVAVSGDAGGDRPGCVDQQRTVLGLPRTRGVPLPEPLRQDRVPAAEQ